MDTWQGRMSDRSNWVDFWWRVEGPIRCSITKIKKESILKKKKKNIFLGGAANAICIECVIREAWCHIGMSSRIRRSPVQNLIKKKNYWYVNPHEACKARGCLLVPYKCNMLLLVFIHLCSSCSMSYLKSINQELCSSGNPATSQSFKKREACFCYFFMKEKLVLATKQKLKS